MSRSANVRWAVVLLCLVASLSAGCAAHAGDDKPASTMSEAQRDSAIARSKIIPGASAVGRAFDVAGRESAHSASFDTLSGN